MNDNLGQEQGKGQKVVLAQTLMACSSNTDSLHSLLVKSVMHRQGSLASSSNKRCVPFALFFHVGVRQRDINNPPTSDIDEIKSMSINGDAVMRLLICLT